MAQYVKKMREELSALNREAQAVKPKIEANFKRYAPDVAKEENAKITAALNERKAKAFEVIDDAYNEAAKAARDWAELAGWRLDKIEDVRLFNGTFKLTAEDLQHLVVKHQTNGTMIRLISDYATENGISVRVPTLEQKLSCYRAFHSSAISTADKIVSEYGVKNAEIDGLGAAGNISHEFETVLYGLTEPEPQTVHTQTANRFQFNFPGIRPE